MDRPGVALGLWIAFLASLFWGLAEDVRKRRSSDRHQLRTPSVARLGKALLARLGINILFFLVYIIFVGGALALLVGTAEGLLERRPAAVLVTDGRRIEKKIRLLEEEIARPASPGESFGAASRRYARLAGAEERLVKLRKKRARVEQTQPYPEWLEVAATYTYPLALSLPMILFLFWGGAQRSVPNLSARASPRTTGAIEGRKNL